MACFQRVLQLPVAKNRLPTRSRFCIAFGFRLTRQTFCSLFLVPCSSNNNNNILMEQCDPGKHSCAHCAKQYTPKNNTLFLKPPTSRDDDTQWHEITSSAIESLEGRHIQPCHRVDHFCRHQPKIEFDRLHVWPRMPIYPLQNSIQPEDVATPRPDSGSDLQDVCDRRRTAKIDHEGDLDMAGTDLELADYVNRLNLRTQLRQCAERTLHHDHGTGAFRPFSRLPAELREMIYLASVEPVTIRAEVVRRDNRRIRPCVFLTEEVWSDVRRARFLADHHTFPPPSPIPIRLWRDIPLYAVNRDARAVAIRNFGLPIQFGFPLNKQVDTVLFDGFDPRCWSLRTNDKPYHFRHYTWEDLGPASLDACFSWVRYGRAANAATDPSNWPFGLWKVPDETRARMRNVKVVMDGCEFTAPHRFRFHANTPQMAQCALMGPLMDALSAIAAPLYNAADIRTIEVDHLRYCAALEFLRDAFPQLSDLTVSFGMPRHRLPGDEVEMGPLENLIAGEIRPRALFLLLLHFMAVSKQWPFPNLATLRVVSDRSRTQYYPRCEHTTVLRTKRKKNI